MKIYLYWWRNFNQTKYKLFLYLTDSGMHTDFAFKKVKKMTRDECEAYYQELNKTSKAYKTGYADGDYWNGSQNPYSPEISPSNYLDYEQGFRQCKKDKKIKWVQEVLAKYK